MNGVESEFELTTVSTFSEEEAAKIKEAAEELQLNKVVTHVYSHNGQADEINGRSSESKSKPSRGKSSCPLSIDTIFGGDAWIKVWRRVELALLVALIVVVWVLLLLPVIFYHLPEDNVSINIAACSFHFFPGFGG